MQLVLARQWEAVTVIGVLSEIDPKAAPVLLCNYTPNNLLRKVVLGTLLRLDHAPQKDYNIKK